MYQAGWAQVDRDDYAGTHRAGWALVDLLRVSHDDAPKQAETLGLSGVVG
ncbi:MAG: hypothetical protein LKJ57_00075 [Ancrocorticia sp.]|nr:hypothetical protein [Ancrocorticia sp.]MCI2011991.1 hypothetical protein [Ancrocorticia sp.]